MFRPSLNRTRLLAGMRTVTAIVGPQEFAATTWPPARIAGHRSSRCCFMLLSLARASEFEWAESSPDQIFGQVSLGTGSPTSGKGFANRPRVRAEPSINAPIEVEE